MTTVPEPPGGGLPVLENINCLASAVRLRVSPAQIASMTDAEFNSAKANPQKWAELQYAIAMAEGLDPAEMSRL